MMTNNANTVQAALNMQWEKWRDSYVPMKHTTLWIGGSILAQYAANSKREPQIKICSARLNACLCVLMLSSGLPPLLRGALLCTSSTSSVSCLLNVLWLEPTVPPCSPYCHSHHFRSPSLSLSPRDPSSSPSIRTSLCSPARLSHSAAAEEHNQINLSVN